MPSSISSVKIQAIEQLREQGLEHRRIDPMRATGMKKSSIWMECARFASGIVVRKR